jgi:hypothetical protein
MNIIYKYVYMCSMYKYDQICIEIFFSYVIYARKRQFFKANRVVLAFSTLRFCKFLYSLKYKIIPPFHNNFC